MDVKDLSVLAGEASPERGKAGPFGPAFPGGKEDGLFQARNVELEDALSHHGVGDLLEADD
ncbi:MAG: hypothetical protein ACI4O6_04135, partial [Dysosmobacter sp.]